jgi:hypothetical protein
VVGRYSKSFGISVNTSLKSINFSIFTPISLERNHRRSISH